MIRSIALLSCALSLVAAEPSITTQSLSGVVWARTHHGASPSQDNVGAGATWTGWTDAGMLLTVGIAGNRTRFVDDQVEASREGGIDGSVAVRAIGNVWARFGALGWWTADHKQVASVLTAGLQANGTRWSLVGDVSATDLTSADDSLHRLTQVTVGGSWCVRAFSPQRGLWLGTDSTLICGRTRILPERAYQFSQGVNATLAWDATSLAVDGWIGSRANAVRYRGTVIVDDTDIHRRGLGVALGRTLSAHWSSKIRWEHDEAVTFVGRDATTSDTFILVTTYTF